MLHVETDLFGGIREVNHHVVSTKRGDAERAEESAERMDGCGEKPVVPIFSAKFPASSAPPRFACAIHGI